MAIDPGVKRSGFAFFVDGELKGAGHVENESLMAILAGDSLLLEMPRVYGGRSARGDTNDLLDLSLMVGRFYQEGLNMRMAVRLVTPAQWKGQTPKEVMQRRTEKQLTHSELSLIAGCKLPKSRAHNMWDAIAMGLFVLTKQERLAYLARRRQQNEIGEEIDTF